MKLLGIGDLFIPGEYIQKGMECLKAHDVDITTVEWQVGDFDNLQKINLMVEQGGREDVEIPDYIMKEAVDADILITQFFPVGRRLIDACTNLKYIGVLRSGCENVDVEYAKSKGITVFHAIGRNAHAVSDFTVGMIICEARNIARGHAGLKNGVWIRDYPNTDTIPDLYEKTVGIIGYGEIGRLVAKKLSGFEVNILVYDPYYHGNDVETVELDELMSRSDFVTIHSRLTPENENMIGAHELGLMKKTAYLINTSRAGLVDEEALYDVLSQKRISGAALDVFKKEPPGKDHPLVNLENVTLTPHMAGGSKDAFFNTPKLIAREMAAYMEGKSTRFLM